MHKADLVRVHKAGIAHHVAAVGQVNRQHRPTAVGHCRGAVVVQTLVVMRLDIAARKHFFEVAEKLSVNGHYVFKVAMDRAVLHHQDLAVALDDLRLDLADLFVQQDLVRQLAVDDLLPNFRNAFGAERVCCTRPAKGRLLLLVALQQGLIRPLRREAGIRLDAVELLEDCPRALGGKGQCALSVLHGFRHSFGDSPEDDGWSG